MFNTVLCRKIAKDFEMPEFVRKGQYVLRQLPSYREIPHGTPFSLAFRPGVHLAMSLIMMYDEKYAEKCPCCPTADLGIENVTQLCPRGTAYTRAKDHTQHITMLPSHFSLQEEHSCGCIHSCAYVEAKPFVDATNHECLGDSHPSENHAVPSFDDFLSVKHVDFSTPPMVLITDLFGYLYSVPWRIVKSVEGLSFFLKHFSAGGSILTWQDDYRVSNDTNTDVTSENWTELGYPGMSLKLHACPQDIGQVIKHKIMGKLPEVLSNPTCERSYDTIAYLCKALGAFNTHWEFRQLIMETATTFCWDKSVLAQTTTPQSAAPSTSV